MHLLNLELNIRVRFQDISYLTNTHLRSLVQFFHEPLHQPEEVPDKNNTSTKKNGKCYEMYKVINVPQKQGPHPC